MAISHCAQNLTTSFAEMSKERLAENRDQVCSLDHVVTNTWLSQKVNGLSRIGFQLPAQSSNIDPHILRLTPVFWSPYPSEQGLVGKYFARVQCQLLQQRKLGG